MAERSAELGAAAQRMLAKRGWGPWDVCRASDGAISHPSVRQLKDGFAIGTDLLVIFGVTTGETEEEQAEYVAELLQKAGRKQLLRLVPLLAKAGPVREISRNPPYGATSGWGLQG